MALPPFDAAFGPPDAMEKTGGLVRITLTAKLERVTAAEALEMQDTSGLRVGYRLHGGISATPALAAGHAELEAAGDSALRCHIALSAAPFAAHPLLLLHVGMEYDGADGSMGGASTSALPDVQPGAQSGIWIAVSAGKPDPFVGYFASFNADRPQP